MKSNLLLLFVFGALATGRAQIQVVHNANPFLREIGGKVYDIFHAGAAFKVMGLVTRVYPLSAEVIRPVAQGFRFKLPPGTDTYLKFSDTGDQLAMAYAMARGQNADGSPRLISLGEYMAMDWRERIFFEPATLYQTNYLLHAQFAKAGQQVCATAVPTTVAGFYDCGTLFTGDRNDLKGVYRLLGDQVVFAKYEGTNLANMKP